MILLPLMVAAADTPAKTPIEAERAFAADAKTIGQWTAFRKWSTDDAVMFVPQPVNAHEFLKDAKDPKKVIDWWPTASWISCDGKLAVNTGGWQRPDGKVGYFSTVWQLQPDGSWKWVVDGGSELTVVRDRPAEPVVVKASCMGKQGSAFIPFFGPGTRTGVGSSKDGTLAWTWAVESTGERRFVVRLWNGEKMPVVLSDKIPAPAK